MAEKKENKSFLKRFLKGAVYGAIALLGVETIFASLPIILISRLILFGGVGGGLVNGLFGKKK